VAGGCYIIAAVVHPHHPAASQLTSSTQNLRIDKQYVTHGQECDDTRFYFCANGRAALRHLEIPTARTNFTTARTNLVATITEQCISKLLKIVMKSVGA
jgi:hypothetical protein